MTEPRTVAGLPAHRLTKRDAEVLASLDPKSIKACFPTAGGWVKPMWIGGFDASHHSATLAKLTRWGLVERKGSVAPWGFRGSYRYRISRQGLRIARAFGIIE